MKVLPRIQRRGQERRQKRAMMDANIVYRVRGEYKWGRNTLHQPRPHSDSVGRRPHDEPNQMDST